MAEFERLSVLLPAELARSIEEAVAATHPATLAVDKIQ